MNNTLLSRIMRLSVYNHSDPFIIKLIGKMADCLKKMILHFTDPLVRIKIFSQNLYMPFSHKLAIYIKYYPYYSTNIGRVALQVEKKYPEGKVIDIGANIGDSISTIRSHSQLPILGVEGDKRYFQILNLNCRAYKNVVTTSAWLGKQSGTSAFKINERDGTIWLSKDICGTSQIYITTLTKLLEKYYLFSQPKLIKIDTDGFDFQIVLGGDKIIRRAKPVLFFEQDPHVYSKMVTKGENLYKTLSDWGYQNGLAWDNHGYFILAFKLDKIDLLSQLNHYFKIKSDDGYMDIAIFHAEDTDLYEKAFQNELSFFK